MKINKFGKYFVFASAFLITLVMVGCGSNEMFTNLEDSKDEENTEEYVESTKEYNEVDPIYFSDNFTVELIEYIPQEYIDDTIPYTEAAQIGANMISELFGINIEGKHIEMAFLPPDRFLNVSALTSNPRNEWLGNITQSQVNDTRDIYIDGRYYHLLFNIDVNGKMLHISDLAPQLSITNAIGESLTNISFFEQRDEWDAILDEWDDLFPMPPQYQLERLAPRVENYLKTFLNHDNFELIFDPLTYPVQTTPIPNLSLNYIFVDDAGTFFQISLLNSTWELIYIGYLDYFQFLQLEEYLP